MFKKIFLISILSFQWHQTYAENVDYSKGNTNPFFNYRYQTPQEQSQYYVSDYFTNEFDNPVKTRALQKKSIEEEQKKHSSSFAKQYDQYKGKYSNSKYKYLIQNQEKLLGCWEGAAKTYKLDPWLLMAIAKVESSFNSKAVNVNKNRSADTGMMQINDIWLQTLRKYGISRQDLFDPCTSVFVGAWILAQNIKHFGYNRDGIGAYNSPGNVQIRRNYAAKVYTAYHEITNDLYYNLNKRK